VISEDTSHTLACFWKGDYVSPNGYIHRRHQKMEMPQLTPDFGRIQAAQIKAFAEMMMGPFDPDRDRQLYSQMIAEIRERLSLMETCFDIHEFKRRT
jgi:hypothetical protein